MFGFSKKDRTEVNPSPLIKEVDNNQIEDYVVAFMINNNIDPKLVMLQSITSEVNEQGLSIKIRAAFPGHLVGKGGKTSQKLAGGLSKMFNCKLKLKISD